MPIARNEVASSLGNPDYWPSRLKFLPRQAIVEKTFEIKGGHIRVLRVIPPCLATEPRPVVRRSVVVFAPTLGSSTRTRDDMNRTHCRLSSRCPVFFFEVLVVMPDETVIDGEVVALDDSSHALTLHSRYWEFASATSIEFTSPFFSPKIAASEVTGQNFLG